MDDPITNPAERNEIIRWWLSQQTPEEQANIRRMARNLIETFKARPYNRQSLGEAGALELIYCVGRWQNKNDRKP